VSWAEEGLTVAAAREEGKAVRSLCSWGKAVGGVANELFQRCAHNFTIFEGTSEIQRLIIGRAVTSLDVR
jgi:alkylation response protein AidB-like acyl-CoA dehydrogenase